MTYDHVNGDAGGVHGTVLPINQDREQLARHCHVDDVLAGLALWRTEGPRGPVVHVIWVDADGVTRQEFVADARVTLRPADY